MTVEEIIETLQLEPLVAEGGLFRQTYSAQDRLSANCLPSRYGRDKAACTAIYYLLTSAPDSFSTLHKLPTDEIYHFYLGDPVELLVLSPDGKSDAVTLGQNIQKGQSLQYVVPRDAWQGSRLIAGGRFALLGTTTAPGFDPQDFTLGDRDELLKTYPHESRLILQLTRANQ